MYSLSSAGIMKILKKVYLMRHQLDFQMCIPWDPAGIKLVLNHDMIEIHSTPSIKVIVTEFESWLFAFLIKFN